MFVYNRESEGEPLSAICLVVYLCRHRGTRRSLRNPPSRPQLRFPSPRSAKTIRHMNQCVCLWVFCVYECVCEQRRAKLSSPHMNKTRHQSLGNPIFTAVSTHINLFAFSPPQASSVQPLVSDTHTHIHTHRKQCRPTSSGPGLARSCFPHSVMKEGNHQSNHSRDRHTVIIRLTFSLPPSFAPIKTWRGSRTTITRREVCNYSIPRQAGQR